MMVFGAIKKNVLILGNKDEVFLFFLYNFQDTQKHAENIATSAGLEPRSPNILAPIF